MYDHLTDSQLLDQLFTAYSDSVYRFICHYLYSHGIPFIKEDAEDLMQETFAVAAARIDKLRDYTNPGGFLMEAAKFKCQEYGRHARRREQVISPAEPPDAPDSANAFAKSDLRMALERELAPSDYQVIQDFYFNGIPTHEIAARRGVKDSTIRSRLSRLRNFLAKNLFLLATFLILRDI